MDLMQQIEENPMISFDNAYSIIACATILQYGVPYPEDLRAAIKRIKSTIYMLIQKNNIKVVYRSDQNRSENNVSDDFYFDDYYDYNLSPQESTVDFLELLTHYNFALESNGLSHILSTNNLISETHIPNDSIIVMIKSVANILKCIFNRDNKITNEQLDSMLNEMSTQIIDPTICKLLPEIKNTLKATAKDKITQGRPSTVDTKKMRAAIDLGEKFKDKTRKYLSLKEINDYLRRHHSELSISDREHVADVYLESKGK